MSVFFSTYINVKCTAAVSTHGNNCTICVFLYLQTLRFYGILSVLSLCVCVSLCVQKSNEGGEKSQKDLEIHLGALACQLSNNALTHTQKEAFCESVSPLTHTCTHIHQPLRMPPVLSSIKEHIMLILALLLICTNTKSVYNIKVSFQCFQSFIRVAFSNKCEQKSGGMSCN